MYVEDYRRLEPGRIKNIYLAYARIFENIDLAYTDAIRNDLTGILFENENRVFTFKLYNPGNYQDRRLTYEPIEIMRIGKNKKTTIPVKVYGITSGYIFNVIESEIYNRDVYESEIQDSSMVFDSNV